MDVLKFRKNLLKWYQKEKRDLPWRNTRDPYKIWISEVMLQQTTVKAVIPYYERWLKTFPDMASLAKSPLQKVLKTWQGLGYYQRARNIHKAACLFNQDFQGRIPSDPSRLIKIPGFGPYTTGAVLSIAFNKRLTIIDANIKRVFARILCLKKSAQTSGLRKIENILKSLLPEKKTGDFNQALMEIGALICKKKSPACLMCPVREFCLAYKKGLQEIIPEAMSKDYQKLTVAVAVIKKKGRYLIQQRPPRGLLAGLWEFPGGKKEKKETLSTCLSREIMEELGCAFRIRDQLIKVRHYYTRFQIDLYAFAVDLDGLPQTENRHKWVTLKQMRHYPFPSGSARIVDYLEGEGSNQ